MRGVIAAPMPSGVEHTWMLKNSRGHPDVIAAPMPSGVEHVARVKRWLKQGLVIAAPMPSGVEHRLAGIGPATIR